MRVCPYCNVASEESNFRPGRKKCRDCEAKDRRSWRAANPEYLREYDRDYYQENKEHRHAYNVAYYMMHQESGKERARKWAREHPEERRAKAREWYADNREHWKAGNKAWLKAHPEKMERMRQQTNMRRARWEKEHPDRSRDKCARRRALTCGVATAERFSRTDVWKRDSGVCHICGQVCDERNWHLDHLVPLTRGGTHQPANVAVAHPRCNMSRGNRSILPMLAEAGV